jgi:hypothetical protein
MVAAVAEPTEQATPLEPAATPEQPGASAETVVATAEVKETAAPEVQASPVSVPAEAAVSPPEPAEAAPRFSPPPFLRKRDHRPAKPAAPRIELPRSPRPAAKEKPRSRFPLLAATLALAAGLGGAAGAVGVPALVHLGFGQATAAAPDTVAIAEIQAIKATIAQLTTDLGALRNGLDQSGKLTVAHFAKVTERLDRAERARVEPAAKLAQIAEALERLERRAAPSASPPADVTGSVKPAAPAAPEAKPKPTIIEDYVVRRVFDGVALVEGRRGIIEVEPGSTLPGAGRVEEIRRQDGRWVVVTNKGLIISAR